MPGNVATSFVNAPTGFVTQTTLLETGFRTANPKRAILKGSGVSDNPSIPTSLQVDFPFGPQNLEYASYEGNYSVISRPYRKPILAYENQQLRTVTFNALIADKASGGTAPITSILENLENMSRLGWRCTFIYGMTALGFDVAITKLSYTVKYRNTDGAPIRAEASLQLTEMPLITQELTLLNAVYRQPVIQPVPAGVGGGGGVGGGTAAPPPIDVLPNQNEALRNLNTIELGQLNYEGWGLGVL